MRSATLALAILTSPPAVLGHDIPTRVVARVIVAPTDGALRVFVRVPLEALRDVAFPLRNDALLDLEKTTPLLPGAVRQWITSSIAFEENGEPVAAPPTIGAIRLSLPSDQSFRSLGAAIEHLASPDLEAGIELPWRQALLDVELRYPIRSATSDFAIRPELAHLGIRTITTVQFIGKDGHESFFQFQGNPGRLPLDPSPWYAGWRFVRFGFGHILEGWDHLLFLIGLILPLRRFRSLIAVVTAFTAAHSITLIAAAQGLVPTASWFPPLVETLIAASIVWMAVENAIGAFPRRRWVVAFGFGLVHGFGFAFALGDVLQFAGRHLVAALVSFNIGVELGQIAVVAVAIPLIGLLFRRVVPERIGVIVIAIMLGHTAWHWMLERGSQLALYPFAWPTLDRLMIAGLLRWSALLIVAGAAGWLFGRLVDRWDKDTSVLPNG